MQMMSEGGMGGPSAGPEMRPFWF